MAILGIDEVGRGPIAGPLVVGAVILPKEEKPWFSELRDSKKLSRNKREYLNELILRSSTTGLGWVPAEDIDKIGMEEALKLATRLAVKRVKSFRVPFSEIIIDGNQNFLAGTSLEPYTTTIVKGDDKILEVSAASNSLTLYARWKASSNQYCTDWSTCMQNTTSTKPACGTTMTDGRDGATYTTATIN